MSGANILNHLAHTVLDRSNIWPSNDITDVPVFAPGSVSLNAGITIYGRMDDYQYVSHVDGRLLFLYGVDPAARYVFIEKGHRHTRLAYRFGGRSFPQCRRNACVRSYGRHIYLSGGLIGRDSPMDDIWQYSIDRNEWTLIGKMPSPRWGHSMSVTTDTISIFGGTTFSVVDGAAISLNDLSTSDADLSGGWTIWDDAAVLPHRAGHIIRQTPEAVYLAIDGYIWVANRESAALEPGQYADLVDIVDVRHDIDADLVLSANGVLTRWGTGGLDVILESVICIGETENDEIRLDAEYNIRLNDVVLGGRVPPLDMPYTRPCRIGNTAIWLWSNMLYMFSADNMDTTPVYLPIEHQASYIAAHGAYVYIFGWGSESLVCGRYSESAGYEEVCRRGDIPPRTQASVVTVQDTIWIIGGRTTGGVVQDQIRFGVSSLEFEKEAVLNGLPIQPAVFFEWRDRLWAIPNRINELYRYYPSQRQWVSVPIQAESGLNLGFVDNNIRWEMVNDRLFLEARGGSACYLDMESLTSGRSAYDGSIALVIDPGHILCTNGKLCVIDGVTLTPVSDNQPPHFTNFGYLGGVKDKDIVEDWASAMPSYSPTGDFLPLYLDDSGMFSWDITDARVLDPKVPDGLYIPAGDYAGELGLYGRRIPRVGYVRRDNFASKTNYGHFVFGDGTYLVSSGNIRRYRSQDGSCFSYNAPVARGSAFGVSSDGKVYIFGGYRDPRTKSMLQNGIDDEGAEKIDKQTLVVYDMGYAGGELEHIATEPKFYARQDFKLASAYLIDRLTAALPLGDDIGQGMAEEMRKKYYLSAQSIIDDIAVRYITYEGGSRPESRVYPFFAQIGQKLYVGGGGKANKDRKKLTFFSSGGRHTFDVFDMETNTWSPLRPHPVDLLVCSSCIASPDGAEIWVVGGFTSAYMTSMSRAIHIYSVSTDTWREIEMPTGYLARARPSLVWLGPSHLLVAYGFRCDKTTCGDDPCYWFNAMGDSWIVHVPTGAVYKYAADLPKTYTVLPDNRDRPYMSIIYSPEVDLPGGHTDVVNTLSLSRILSTDWGPYISLYADELDRIYSAFLAVYEGVTFISASGEVMTVDFTGGPGLATILSIYEYILPNQQSTILLSDYDGSTAAGSDGLHMFGDSPLPIPTIRVNGHDFTRLLLVMMQQSGSRPTARLLFSTLDMATGALYPANMITLHDKLIIDISLVSGDMVNIKKIVSPVQFSIDDVAHSFTYRDGDLWMCIYAEGQLRFLRCSPRPDGDIDLSELAVDLPVSSAVVTMGYDGMDCLIVVFGQQSIWRLNLALAIVDPNASSWRRLPPPMELGTHLRAGMRAVISPSGEMCFMHPDGEILAYNTSADVWRLVRGGMTANADILIDGVEVHYLGDSPRYFDLSTMQGDRFEMNYDQCELAHGTPVLPKLAIQRNRIMGFDRNANLLAAYTRKQGVYDRSWRFDCYVYVSSITISVDYGSMDPDYFSVFVRTPSGLRRCECRLRYATEPWSFNVFTREYDNGVYSTRMPDQYVIADVGDSISEAEVIFSPPVKEYGYTAHINGVALVPVARSGIGLSTKDHYLACKDSTEISINNMGEGRLVHCSSDSADLVMSANKSDLAARTTAQMNGRSQMRLALSALSSGKIAHIMLFGQPN